MRLRLLILLFFPFSLNAQVDLIVQPVWKNQQIQLGDTFLVNQSQQIRFDTFKFYLSDIAFYQDTILVYSDSEKAHLIDLDYDSTLQIHFTDLNLNAYNLISFQFGIDSATNVSGAMSGDLDPMYGMYWSWQSGYINCKLEGQIIDAESTDFQYHIGGYLPPFNASKTVKLSLVNAQSVNLELAETFNELLLDNADVTIMSPCDQAVSFSNSLAHSFYAAP